MVLGMIIIHSLRVCCKHFLLQKQTGRWTHAAGGYWQQYLIPHKMLFE